MQAGKLDRRITIQRAIIATDDFGGSTKTWVPIAMVPASVDPISDGERWRAGEVAAHVTTRFQIRWGQYVETTDRILYEYKVFEIYGVKEIGRREGQEITASARAEIPTEA